MTDGNVQNFRRAVIAANIKRLRQSSGVTQQQLARYLGITFQQVQKYESGQNRLPCCRLYELKQYWGVSYDEFFKGL